jgi:aspartyl-tRNA(Asn)/glutamyl-tRNA(Gln) amidotransferase subunit B
VQITDAGALETAIEEVLKSSPAQLEQYKQGKEKLFGYFVGQVMKATKGKANPKLVNEILRKKLSE